MTAVTRFHPISENWRLDIRQHVDPETLDPTRKPLVMVPGYAMNAFILGFHPSDISMLEFLVQQGFEVWTANLRGQGASRRMHGTTDYGFRELGCIDLPTVRDVVLEQTETDRDTFDLVGCSLGATVVYAYLACQPDSHSVSSVIAIGGPLRWEAVHPAIKLLFASPTVAGLLPTRATRQMARLALPFVKKLPTLASIYMNVHQIDLDQADELVKTVDNPNRYLNQQIALWIKNKDLMVGGINVTEAMSQIHTPVLCVLANRDGIVPPEAALSVRDAIGTDDVEVLRVGTPDKWYAHADLFISHKARQKVFEPLASWLERREGNH